MNSVTNRSAPRIYRFQRLFFAASIVLGRAPILPDARITVTHEIVSAPWIVQEFTFEGTHKAPLTGPMGTIAATNRKVSGQCVSITRYENDLAVESRLYFDVVQLLTQLGVMPVPAKN